MWCLQSCGIDKQLRLLCLPHGVRRMLVQLSYHCTVTKKKKRRKQKQKSFTQHQKIMFRYKSSTFEWTTEDENVEIQIGIISMYDMDNVLIPKEEWEEFGVESESKWTTFALSVQQ